MSCPDEKPKGQAKQHASSGLPTMDPATEGLFENARAGDLNFEMILALGNPVRAGGWTLAHEAAAGGMAFSEEEVTALEDPQSADGWRLSEVNLWAKKAPEEDILGRYEAGRRLSPADLHWMNTSVGRSAIWRLVRKGRYRFSVHEILTLGNPVDPERVPLALHAVEMDARGFDFEAILRLGNPADPTGWSVAHALADKGHIFTLSELIQLGNPGLTQGTGNRTAGWSVAHVQASYGHPFSGWEIERLGNPVDENGETLWHCNARAGHPPDIRELLEIGDPANKDGMTVSACFLNEDQCNRYSVGEILSLGNPRCWKDGLTLAGRLAICGRGFSARDVLRLGNPIECENDGRSLAHLCVMYANNPPWIRNEDLFGPLGNPCDDQGNTLAHYMVWFTHRYFSDLELALLGDPINDAGESVSDVMRKEGLFDE